MKEKNSDTQMENGYKFFATETVNVAPLRTLYNGMLLYSSGTNASQ